MHVGAEFMFHNVNSNFIISQSKYMFCGSCGASTNTVLKNELTHDALEAPWAKLKLPWAKWNCRECSWNCREQIETAVSEVEIAVSKLKLPWAKLKLPWANWNCREQIEIAVTLLGHRIGQTVKYK